MREVGHHARRGFHPLDVALGLVGDRFSWNVLTLAARLATKLSFAEARATLAAFVPDAPSTEVIEHTVLGLGRHTWVRGTIGLSGREADLWRDRVAQRARSVTLPRRLE